MENKQRKKPKAKQSKQQTKMPVALGFYVNFSNHFLCLLEARKLNVNRNTGETILHKAARLGYHVSITCTTLAQFELCFTCR